MPQMCGPTGIGILHAKSDLLNSMPPFLGTSFLKLCSSLDFKSSRSLKFYLELTTCSSLVFVGGGEMIADVFLDHSTYAESPSRYVWTTRF